MLGEFMLLAILGNVPVLGSFIAITAAYHIKLGSRRPPSPPACHRALPGAAIAAAIATASLAAAAIAASHHRFVGGCLSAGKVGCLSPLRSR